MSVRHYYSLCLLLVPLAPGHHPLVRELRPELVDLLLLLLDRLDEVGNDRRVRHALPPLAVRVHRAGQNGFHFLRNQAAMEGVASREPLFDVGGACDLRIARDVRRAANPEVCSNIRVQAYTEPACRSDCARRTCR